MVHLIFVAAASLLAAFLVSLGVFVKLTERLGEHESWKVGVPTYTALILTFLGMLWLLT